MSHITTSVACPAGTPLSVLSHLYCCRTISIRIPRTIQTFKDVTQREKLVDSSGLSNEVKPALRHFLSRIVDSRPSAHGLRLYRRLTRRRVSWSEFSPGGSLSHMGGQVEIWRGLSSVLNIIFTTGVSPHRGSFSYCRHHIGYVCGIKRPSRFLMDTYSTRNNTPSILLHRWPPQKELYHTECIRLGEKKTHFYGSFVSGIYTINMTFSSQHLNV
ncbi:hypothetical protein EV702DRAFT_74306 [Suillus placidus]|uniref:Uncharacterized protein n=1 Tax=Suillus placidus TaxID=48579 RepID=A0A9P7A154_9AGAM|nr:hypothetical protein EV702DRAFT_74306 [Suillus placidus]